MNHLSTLLHNGNVKSINFTADKEDDSLVSLNTLKSPLLRINMQNIPYIVKNIASLPPACF